MPDTFGTRCRTATTIQINFKHPSHLEVRQPRGIDSVHFGAELSAVAVWPVVTDASEKGIGVYHLVQQRLFQVGHRPQLEQRF